MSLQQGRLGLVDPILQHQVRVDRRVQHGDHVQVGYACHGQPPRPRAGDIDAVDIRADVIGIRLHRIGDRIRKRWAGYVPG